MRDSIPKKSPRERRGRRQQGDGGSIEREIIIDYQALADALLQKEPRLRAFRQYGRGPIDPRLLPDSN